MDGSPWGEQMRKILLLTLAILALPMEAASEEARVGVVATVVGTATVARVAQPEPALLKLRDDVFVRDQITTGERSFVRVLLGGKATVSAREHSILRITERPSVSTVALAAGRIATAVSKDRVKPGEIVEIRTPNAVVAIRGTVVIAEVWPTPAGLRSTITILRGVVEISGLDPATDQPVGAPVTVSALERITVVGDGPLPAPERITADAAKRLTDDFTVIPKNAPRASFEASTRFAADLALKDVLRGAASTTSSGASLLGGGAAVVGGVVTGAASTLGAVTLPLGDVPLPTGGVALPTGSLALPTGGVTLPTGGVTLPLGGVTLPLGGVKLPIAPKLP